MAGQLQEEQPTSPKTPAVPWIYTADRKMFLLLQNKAPRLALLRSYQQSEYSARQRHRWKYCFMEGRIRLRPIRDVCLSWIPLNTVIIYRFCPKKKTETTKRKNRNNAFSRAPEDFVRSEIEDQICWQRVTCKWQAHCNSSGANGGGGWGAVAPPPPPKIPTKKLQVTSSLQRGTIEVQSSSQFQ